jgi:hypothetical protein
MSSLVVDSRWDLSEVTPLGVLSALAGVEGRDRAVVAHDAGPDLAARALGGVEVL